MSAAISILCSLYRDKRFFSSVYRNVHPVQLCQKDLFSWSALCIEDITLFSSVSWIDDIAQLCEKDLSLCSALFRLPASTFCTALSISQTLLISILSIFCFAILNLEWLQLCCALLCCGVLWCALLCCAVVRCGVVCCGVLCCGVLCCTFLSSLSCCILFLLLFLYLVLHYY